MLKVLHNTEDHWEYLSHLCDPTRVSTLKVHVKHWIEEPHRGQIRLKRATLNPSVSHLEDYTQHLLSH